MNILYLTSEYKDESYEKGDTFTYISNSFCRKWVKQGHDVIVIHNASVFPKLLYLTPIKVKRFIEKKLGSMWGSYESVCKKTYCDCGVKVFRMPIKKLIPHSPPSRGTLNKQANDIRLLLEQLNFTPDVVIGQWISPQTELISRLKYFYNCRTAVVCHGTGYLNGSRKDFFKCLAEIDRIGARSKSQSRQIQKILGLDYSPFVCYSGIPDEFIDSHSINLGKFEQINKWKFAFVGRLVEYKKVDVIIKSLSRIENLDWELNIVGEGAQLKELIGLAKELSCDDRVIFHGKISRDNVMNILAQCHCFIMVSVREVFGLVYLEAMGASCITVASKNGGVDGIIESGINGFLVDEGNESQLTELINSIIRMDKETLQRVAFNGYRTAVSLSETNASKDFLEKVTK